MNPEELSTNTSPQEERKPAKSLRTYKGDVEEAISKNNYSASSIMLAEQQRGNQSHVDMEQPRDNTIRNKFFAIAGGALLLLGIITVSAVYYIKSSETTAVIQRTKAIIGFSEERDLNVATSTSENLIGRIISEKQGFKMPINSVLYINTVKANGTPIETQNLLLILAPRMPDSLSRAFDGKYMIGVYSYDTNEPFIILTTSDFASSFAGMLGWEKDMVQDLGKMFSVTQNTASTTKVFVDVTMRNKDLRVLRDSTGKTLMLYSFINKSTLLITKNETILNSVVAKYLISNQGK